MNSYFIAKHEDFRKVYLYLCRLDLVEAYVEHLRYHGFTDIKAITYDAVEKRIQGITYHPHVVIFDEALLPCEMWKTKLDLRNGTVMRRDMNRKYCFIRCFVKDPLCFFAAANMKGGWTEKKYDDLYERAIMLQASHHTQQEIAAYYNPTADEKTPTDEEVDEDLILYYDLEQ